MKGDGMHEPRWEQPNPSDLQAVTDPPVPDTETLLAEVGSSYPVVTYPASQDSREAEQGPDTAVERTIFAGLVWP
jgi:hypothetical protein